MTVGPIVSAPKGYTPSVPRSIENNPGSGVVVGPITHGGNVVLPAPSAGGGASGGRPSSPSSPAGNPSVSTPQLDLEAKPIPSMSKEEAAAQGFTYSGAAGWVRPKATIKNVETLQAQAKEAAAAMERQQADIRNAPDNARFVLEDGRTIGKYELANLLASGQAQNKDYIQKMESVKSQIQGLEAERLRESLNPNKTSTSTTNPTITSPTAVSTINPNVTKPINKAYDYSDMSYARSVYAKEPIYAKAADVIKTIASPEGFTLLGSLARPVYNPIASAFGLKKEVGSSATDIVIQRLHRQLYSPKESVGQLGMELVSSPAGFLLLSKPLTMAIGGVSKGVSVVTGARVGAATASKYIGYGAGALGLGTIAYSAGSEYAKGNVETAVGLAGSGLGVLLPTVHGGINSATARGPAKVVGIESATPESMNTVRIMNPEGGKPITQVSAKGKYNVLLEREPSMVEKLFGKSTATEKQPVDVSISGTMQGRKFDLLANAMSAQGKSTKVSFSRHIGTTNAKFNPLESFQVVRQDAGIDKVMSGESGAVRVNTKADVYYDKQVQSTEDMMRQINGKDYESSQRNVQRTSSSKGTYKVVRERIPQGGSRVSLMEKTTDYALKDFYDTLGTGMSRGRVTETNFYHELSSPDLTLYNTFPAGTRVGAGKSVRVANQGPVDTFRDINPGPAPAVKTTAPMKPMDLNSGNTLESMTMNPVKARQQAVINRMEAVRQASREASIDFVMRDTPSINRGNLGRIDAGIIGADTITITTNPPGRQKRITPGVVTPTLEPSPTLFNPPKKVPAKKAPQSIDQIMNPPGLLQVPEQVPVQKQATIAEPTLDVPVPQLHVPSLFPGILTPILTPAIDRTPRISAPLSLIGMMSMGGSGWNSPSGQRSVARNIISARKLMEIL